MVRRITLAALWFISSWLTYGLVAYFLGLPDSGGAVLGALLAAFVFMDPTGQLWAGSDRSTNVTTPSPASSRTEPAVKGAG